MVDNTTNKIGEKNPYRYRSYYYDSETTWYYLNSRYYDPNIGRFITMDEIEYLGATSTLLSYNLFTYCEGNPISLKDPYGTDAIYVVDYDMNSWFFEKTGHAILYYQAKSGKWWKTEFIGKGKDKSTAEVKSKKIGTLDDVYEDIMISKNYKMYYISGDYTALLPEVTKLYNDEVDKFYGGYDLLSNNCLHYVKDMLRLGRAYNPKIDKYIKRSWDIIPKNFYVGLERESRVFDFVPVKNITVNKIINRMW